MIDTTVIEQRIEQLRQEQAQVTADLQQRLNECEQMRHLLSAYDGAIGELQRLTLAAVSGAALETNA